MKEINLDNIKVDSIVFSKWYGECVVKNITSNKIIVYSKSKNKEVEFDYPNAFYNGYLHIIDETNSPLESNKSDEKISGEASEDEEITSVELSDDEIEPVVLNEEETRIKPLKKRRILLTEVKKDYRYSADNIIDKLVVKNDNTQVSINITFCEKYNLIPNEYQAVPVFTLPFSVRLINSFMKNSITTLEDLLKTTPSFLMNLNGFGKKCLDEVYSFFASFSDKCTPNIQDEHIPSYSVFINNRDELALGNFCFFEDMDLSEDKVKMLKKYKEAYDVLGEKLAFDCVISPQNVLPIIEMFKSYQNYIKQHIEIVKLANSLPNTRRNNKALVYINAFTINENERSILKSLCESEEATLLMMAKTDNKINDPSTYALLKKFYKWCAFDLEKEINGFFDNLFSKENMRIAIQLRAKKETLEQIGETLGVTRERVRQIEFKAKRKFSYFCDQMRIIPKIFAEQNGNVILTPDKINTYFKKHSSVLLFLLRTYESANYTYDRHFDVFVFGNTSVTNIVQSRIDTLPEIIKENQLEMVLCNGVKGTDIPIEVLKKAFLEDYQHTGKVYYRYRLSISTILEMVIDSYYPKGIKVYDIDEISRFRKIVSNEYGDIGLPSNDRALSNRIIRICVLCGRGLYRLKNEKYLPVQLANEICEYIENSENTIFLTNTLFSTFEKKLLDVGIDNKYFLQGVLHDMFPDKFVFRRDYISKDVEITSVYSSVVNYIKHSNFPVSKAEIQNAFPGITDIVITLSVNDPNVINYFGEYLHASKLNIYDYEKSYLFKVINELTNDSKAHHIQEIYDIVVRQRPEILTRNAAMNPFSTFSVAEYLFRDKFHFSRPYIAKHGVEIGRPAERLHDLIYSEDEFNISEISEFSKENHFQINSLLEYINECNDEFLLINDETMMKIDRIGIDKDIAYQVENIIAESINETTPIRDLTIFARLPQIKVPWTDWLIYSMIFKWGTKVVVGTSSNQFRLSIPLIAPVDNFDPSLFKDIDKSDTSTSHIVDDLNNIDSLLEDIIEDEFHDIF